jgi:hypothetical protein
MALPTTLRWHDCNAIASLMAVQLASSALDNCVAVLGIGRVAHSARLVGILVWDGGPRPNALLSCLFFSAHLLTAALLR